MDLIANSLNNRYPRELAAQADRDELTQIDLAVAYVSRMDELFNLAERRDVPFNLYALADGEFPHIDVIRRFIESGHLSWHIFLTRAFFHPKIMWFRGIGAYIGSANLSDRAWVQNIECGVWIPQEELISMQWVGQLDLLFRMIAERSVAATSDHLKALVQLRKRRGSLIRAQQEFQADVDRALADLPGNQAPTDITIHHEPGGVARQMFLREWNQSLTILHKVGNLFAANRQHWPRWVDRDVPASIVQDQATEWWWDTEFRRTRESRLIMEEVHRKNAVNPDAAVRSLLDRWCKFDGSGHAGDSYPAWINEHPRELSVLLMPDELAQLDIRRLGRILYLCHASREHARQIPNHELGLPAGETRTREERAPLLAEYLWSKTSRKGRRIKDLLEFVLWGDRRAGSQGNIDVANRIWIATHNDEWRLPHLGVHILGELLGYARPDQYPPRNNRVSKTLYALGFSGIAFE